MSCYLPLASFWFLLHLCLPPVRSTFIFFHFFLFLQIFFHSILISVATSFPNAVFASIQCTSFCTLPFPLRLLLSPALPFRTPSLLLCHCLHSLPLSQPLLLPLTAFGEGRCGRLKRGVESCPPLSLIAVTSLREIGAGGSWAHPVQARTSSAGCESRCGAALRLQRSKREAAG